MLSNIKTLLLGLVLLSVVACSQEKDAYTQTISSTEGITDAELSYAQSDSILLSQKLTTGDITYARVGNEAVTVLVTDAGGTTLFDEVPSKYINLDATVEVTRNVFHDYFPAEWAPMKGQPYTTLYIKSKQDNQVFYMKCVFTNTDKEIGKYSEDF